MTWNEPGADPAADIQMMMDALANVREQAGYAPNTILVNAKVWRSLIVWFLIPGRWPWHAVQRWVLRWALGKLWAYQDAMQPPEDDEGDEETRP